MTLKHKLKLLWAKRKPLPSHFAKTPVEVHARREQLWEELLKAEKRSCRSAGEKATQERDVAAFKLAVFVLDWTLPPGLTGKTHIEERK